LCDVETPELIVTGCRQERQQRGHAGGGYGEDYERGAEAGHGRVIDYGSGKIRGSKRCDRFTRS
jgi:hypothetical protein